MDQIAVGCALDYTMYRFDDRWRSENSKLNKWFTIFVENIGGVVCFDLSV